MFTATTMPAAEWVQGPEGPHEAVSSRAAHRAEPVPSALGEGAAVCWQWFAAALDELDYGMLLLTHGDQVAHVNHAARVDLDGAHPLQLLGTALKARRPVDAAPLRSAIEQASARGLRRLLTLGEKSRQTSISIVPLAPSVGAFRAVLIVLAKSSVCESLSIQGFARAHKLTATETRVLAALCGGDMPAQIAVRLGVAVSTIRSHVGNLRAKTGSASIRALVGQVAVLPPLMGVLREPSGGRSGAGLDRPLLS